MSTKISRTIERTVLDNGARILSSFRKGDTAAFAIGFNHGAVFDPAEADGLSHGVEHFLLKAAPGYPYRRASRLLEECGLVSAQTTKFRILVPCLVAVGRHRRGNFKRAFRVLSKLVAEPTFNDQEFELEKEAIIHEIEDTEADPSWQAQEFLYETLFSKENPLSRTIIGTADILKRIERSSLLSFYRSLFDPQRIVVLSHGALTHRDLVRAAESFFRRREKQIKAGSGVVLPDPASSFKYAEMESWMKQEPPPNFTIRPQPLYSDKIPPDLGGIAVGCRVPHFGSEYRYALDVLKYIVGGHMLEDTTLYSGDIFYELREKRGLIYHPDEVQYESSPWSGCFYLRFQTNHGLLEKAEEVLVELFRSYLREGITRQALESAKRKMDSHFVILRAKYDFQFMDWMLQAEIGGRPEEPDEYIRKIRAVKRSMVMELLEKYFDPDRQLVRALVFPIQDKPSVTDGDKR